MGESRPRKRILKPDSFDHFKEALIISGTDTCKGWNWVRVVILESFNFVKTMELRLIGPQRALLYFNDKRALKEMLELEGVVENGTMISFGEWEIKTPTLEEDWFYRRDCWVNIIGLPLQLWSIRNAKAIAEEVRDGLVEIDKQCKDFFRIGYDENENETGF